MLVSPLLAALSLIGVALALPSITHAGSRSRLTPISKLAPNDLIEMVVQDVVPLPELDAHVVLLVSTGGTVLPIFIDESAAIAIAFRLAHRAPPLPLAEDLLDSMVSQMGGRVSEVRIADSKNDADQSRILIRQGKHTVTLAARPSDSIAMALSSGAKIFATRELVLQAGVTREDIEKARPPLPGKPGFQYNLRML